MPQRPTVTARTHHLETIACPKCGDRNLVRVRCTFEAPARGCEAPGNPHAHGGCTRCLNHWVEPLTAHELATLTCPN